MIEQEFKNKVAVVTGTSGIGRAIALRFAAAGAQVVSFGIDAPANDRLAADARSKGLAIEVRRCDVSAVEEARAAIEFVTSKYLGLDFIVNAAAIHPFGTVLETDPDTWNRCFAVNVGSIYLFAHFGLPALKKRGGGVILNVSSVQATACQTGVAAYAATKGAINSLTRALALDHAAENIRVNSISPGSVRTPMLERSAAHFSPGGDLEETLRRFGAAHPLGRIGTPEEVAELAAFLASDRAAFCTGGDYLVDGGLLAGIGVR